MCRILFLCTLPTVELVLSTKWFHIRWFNNHRSQIFKKQNCIWYSIYRFLFSLDHHQCKNHSHSIYINYIKQSVDDLKILNDVCKLNINITTIHDGFQRSKIWKFLEQYLAIIYLRNMVKKMETHYCWV